MLTTTVDGLWVLQLLTGIEVLHPALGLRPLLPSVETRKMAMAHPLADELRAHGVLTESGVDAVVVEWLTVLSRHDVALFIQVRTPDDDGTPTRVLLARFARWWVVMERSADLIRLSGVGSATTEGAAGVVITSQLERIFGSAKAAPLRPVTLDVKTVLSGATTVETLRTRLADQRLDAEQLQILLTAVDPRRSAQASVVGMQTGVRNGTPTRVHIEPSVVTIIDTSAGRLVGEPVCSAGNSWMILAPGTTRNIGSAVNNLLRRLPAGHEWFSYQKNV